jgi:hypothetical protein
MDLILDICVKNQVPVDDIPNLLVFTDGQFDEMNQPNPHYNNGFYRKKPLEYTPWKTTHEILMKKWADAGYDRMPTIIYWNLRANTPGIQTSEDHPGVQLLQGYSPSLLKFVLFGEKVEETQVEVETENGIVKMFGSALRN